MVNSDLLRNRLNQVLAENGLKLVYVAKTLGWGYEHLNKFKNGKVSHMSAKREEMLGLFLDKYNG